MVLSRAGTAAVPHCSFGWYTVPQLRGERWEGSDEGKHEADRAGWRCLPSSQPSSSFCWDVLEIAGIAEVFLPTHFPYLNTQCKPQRIHHVSQADKGRDGSESPGSWHTSFTLAQGVDWFNILVPTSFFSSLAEMLVERQYREKAARSQKVYLLCALRC